MVSALRFRGLPLSAVPGFALKGGWKSLQGALGATPNTMRLSLAQAEASFGEVIHVQEEPHLLADQGWRT